MTYEKIIEQLKDEMKKEQVEKTKLLQYKLTKSKRLEDLETKAREFEVLSNINLPKMIGMLESRDTEIASLKSKEKLSEGFIGAQLRLRDTLADSFRRKISQENKVKSEAIVKLEAMRNELQLVEGGADNGMAEIWKDKCRKLVEICKSFKEENERLQRDLLKSSHSEENEQPSRFKSQQPPTELSKSLERVSSRNIQLPNITRKPGTLAS